MKTHQAALALPLFLLPAAAPTAVEGLRFGPEEGSSVSKSFEVRGSVELDNLSVTFNGEEADASAMGMPSDLGLEFGYDIGCVDSYEELGEGEPARPLVLVRAFDEASGYWEDQDGEGDSGSFIDGATVRFAWSDEAEAYERSFDDEGGDDDVLEMLREDLDLRALLPPDGEDEWEVGGEALLSVLAPGFDLGPLLESASDDGMPEELVTALRGVFENLSVECSFDGTTEEDGVELARFSFTSEIDETVALDAASMINGDEGDQELDWERFDATLYLEIEGEGTWDGAAGHFRSLEVASEGGLEIDFGFGLPGMDIQIEGTGEFLVELAHSASAGE